MALVNDLKALCGHLQDESGVEGKSWKGWCSMVVWYDGVAWWCGMVVWYGGVAWWCGMVVWHGGVAWWCGMVVWHGGVARVVFVLRGSGKMRHEKFERASKRRPLEFLGKLI